LRPSATGNQTLRGELSSHTPSPPERREFEGDGEYVFARFEIERLQFNYFDGYLNELRLPMARTEIEVEQPPAGWERVHPLDVEARVHITDGFGGTLSAEIHAETRLNGAPVGARDLLIDDVALTDTTVIITGLAELMQDYPDTLSAEGEAVLSGDVAVYSNVEVNLAVELRAGFSLTLEGEIEPEGTVEKIDSRELDDVQSGTATVKLWNHLPAGGRCFLVASRDSLTVLNSSGADADTLFDVHVPSAPTEAGRATGLSYYEFDVALDSIWLDYLRTPPFFTRVDVTIASANGDSITVYGGDYISVQAIADVIYTVHPGEVE
jgi:hypothetical protein